ncbi:MAG: GNAT family N-acetyltransferase [Pyrinomonadaceae bacterium]
MTHLPADIEVVAATSEQEPILANLLELYIHDFSEFLDLDLGPDGRFGYKYLSLYWKEPGHHPFIIEVNGGPAGFVLVRKGSQISGDENIWDITEFFVVRRHRRSGVGMTVAHRVWRWFPGKWEIRVRDSNRRAIAFWDRAVSELTGKTADRKLVKNNGETWHVVSFES